MKLASGTKLLGKALATVGYLAGLARGPNAHLKHMVHVKWTTNSVVLTAADGHRAYVITLLGEGVGDFGTPGESTILLSPEPWAAPLQLSTIFRGPNGEVKLIGVKYSPVGISRTRVEPDFYPLDLGRHSVDWPTDFIDRTRAEMQRGFFSDHGNNRWRSITINPVYLGEALATATMFWTALDAIEPPMTKLIVPAHLGQPLGYVTEWPEKAQQPVFRFEAIIMPYLVEES